MRSIITYFIKYPVAGNLLMFLLFIFGYFGFQSLKSTFFPEAESRIINIQIVYPGASPEEIEEGVVIKIEENLKGVTGIERFTSVSQENTGSVKVEVFKGYDTDLILQDVKNAVDRISTFPVGMEPPVIYKVENLNFAISFALNGVESLHTLKDYARKIERDLLAVPGISKVEVEGFPEEEIEIALREDDLQAYALTFQEAAAAVQRSNIEITGGTIKAEREELLIRGKNKRYTAAELRDIVVKTTADGVVIRLNDIANVEDRWEDLPNRSFFNGKPAVVVKVSNTVDEDILYIADYVKQYLNDFNAKNDQIKATIIRDGTINLVQRIELLTENGVMGFFLVLLFLSFFLNIRLAFWVAISIPISFAGMFILASFYGLTINVMSLFGMIIVVGILVDDGIVIGENIYQHYERGKTAVQAAVDGTLEVLPSVISAVLTTVVAFSTFFFIDGRLGEFAPALAFVVISTLTISLFEGALILPAHIAHSKSLQGPLKKSKFEQFFDNILSWFRENTYAPFLRFSLTNKFLAFAIPIAFLMLTFGGLGGGIIKLTFFPFIERDNIDVTVEMTPGTREHVTADVLNAIEAAALRVSDKMKAERPDGKDVIINIEKKLGPLKNQGTLNIILLDNEARNLQSYLIANAIRTEAGNFPEADKVIFGSGSPFGKPISVSLLSNNLNELELAKAELKREMENLSSLKDVSDNDRKGIREIKITLKEKAYLLGLRLQDVVAQVRQGFFGYEVQRLQRGIDEVKVWTRYAEDERASLGNLERMRIRFGNGNEVPLSEVADYTISRGTVAINHLDGKREINIEAELANPNESAPVINNEIEANILPAILARYPSVSFTFEGQTRQNAKVQASMKKVIPIVLILMIAIVVFTFRSFWQAFVVFLMLPFGIIGVGWGHWIHGLPISLLSFFGVIALIGVMVNDSLVLIAAFNRNLKDGHTFYISLYKAGISRFRPIVLTSATTIAGLAPLILERSFQAQFLVPMAIAIAYGLAIATYTTLILLPVALITINRIKIYLTWLWEGKKPNELEVEPAIVEQKFEDDEHKAEQINAK